MKAGRRYPVSTIIGLALISSGHWAASALGDGGTLRVWKQIGSREIAVFTEPSPFVTGPVDISVLLLDRETGEPDRRARVVVEVAPEGQPDRAARSVDGALVDLRHLGRRRHDRDARLIEPPRFGDRQGVRRRDAGSPL